MLKLIVAYYSGISQVQPRALASAEANEAALGFKITWIYFQEILNYGLAKLCRGH